MSTGERDSASSEKMLSTVTMSHPHPPTPPSGHQDFDLHQIMQHNAATQYPFHVNQEEAASYGPGGEAYLQHAYEGEYEAHDVGLGISIENYGHGDHGFYDERNAYNTSPFPHGMQNSPPTPHSTTNSDIGAHHTRSRTGQSFPSSSPRGGAGSAKSTPAPRTRKTKAKSDKHKTPRLTAPLSELTKHMTHVPLRDIQAWVNRSLEDRRAEVAKRKGYVARPMNSFMLYRSAYADRTKEWCTQNNHQVVSSISGESWPLEPPEVREQYNEWARVERMNHQKAHPNYKFSPSKAGANKKRKGSPVSDPEEEYDNGTDFDDPDGEWNPHGRRGNRTSKRRQYSPAVHRSGDPAIAPDPAQIQELQNRMYSGLQLSSWEATNAGKPPPASIRNANALGAYGPYYHQTTVHPYGRGTPGVEDVMLHRVHHPALMSSPATGQHPHHPHQVQLAPMPLAGLPRQQQQQVPSRPSSGALVGIPSAAQQQLFHLRSYNPTPVPSQHHYHGGGGGHPTLQPHAAPMPDAQLDPALMAQLDGVGQWAGKAEGTAEERFGLTEWEPDQALGPAQEVGSEFEKWMMAADGGS